MLLTIKPGEAEHANLLGDVVPGSGGPQSLQLCFQLIPHQQHSVCHGLHVAFPRMEMEGGEGWKRMRDQTKVDTCFLCWG